MPESIMKEIIEQYRLFVSGEVKSGTGTVHSYIRAMKIVDEVLRTQTNVLKDGESLWEVRNEGRLQDILTLIKQEKAKPEYGIFKVEKSVSYIKKNFCSSAVRMYREFVLSRDVTQEIFDETATMTDGVSVENVAIKRLKVNERKLLDAFDNKKEGKERVQVVMARVNQNLFRKFVLANFQGRCCLTGLDIPDILRASHIVAWKEDGRNRLNPENGLCLSATYDAAFDRHLISFDEDYRLIVSKRIKDFYTNASVQAYFQKLEGCKLETPVKFLPSQTFLENHRALLKK